MHDRSTISTPKPGAGYRYLVVGLLAVVYTFNFMDRQILSTLTEPIRKDLGLSRHPDGRCWAA